MNKRRFKMGDLVKPNRDLAAVSPEKTYGVVIRTKLLGIDQKPPVGYPTQAVNVYWAGYGIFWDSSLRLELVVEANGS
jgi:hypothetical protein|tara:strand:+ start:229 stop:462 length:234 start_codon:yes stop_codon:yes gene_type:complete